MKTRCGHYRHLTRFLPRDQIFTCHEETLVSTLVSSSSAIYRSKLFCELDEKMARSGTFDLPVRPIIDISTYVMLSNTCRQQW